MVLRGAVHGFPLDTVLRLLAATDKTGVLEVRSGDDDGSLETVRGQLVSARFGDDRGDVALGPIFAIERGDFEFRELDRTGDADLDGDLDTLLGIAAEQRARVRAVRTLIPHDRLTLQLSTRAADRGEIRLAPDEWRVLLAVDGRRDVAAVAEQLGISRLAAASHLADLVQAGLIDAIEPAADAPAVDARPTYARLLPPMTPLAPTGAGEPVELVGSIPEFPLETILQLLAATDKTGRLEVRGGAEGYVLSVERGRLVSAIWGDEAGELALGAAFTVAGGEFSFVPMPAVGPADLEGDLDELLDRAVAARDRIAANRAIIPSERMRFRLSERAAQLQPQITLTSEQWRALLAVNGDRDVTLIAQQLRMRRLPTIVLLADLVRGGLIDVLPPPEPGQEAPPADRELTWPFVERRRLPWQPEVTEHDAPAPAAEPEVAEPEAAEPVEESAIQAPIEETPIEETPIEETPVDRAVLPEAEAPADDRLSALSGLFGPAEPAPPPAAWEPPLGEAEAAAAEATAAAFASSPEVEEPQAPPEVDPRLAAFGAPPAEPEPGEWTAPSEWTAPAWETPPEESAPAESDEIDSRLAALALPPAESEEAPSAPEPAAEEAWPDATHLRREPVPVQPLPEIPPVGEAPSVAAPEKKKGGLFGGLFGAKTQPAGTTSAASLARTDAGRLALFANELIAAYNSGQYGRARVEDRMIGLLMRVDEQADPIDRPLPVSNDRIDVASIDDGAVSERQAVPYLATLVRQVYDDAERVLGKDKARRGYRDVRDRVFGKELAVLRAPQVAGRMPKV